MTEINCPMGCGGELVHCGADIAYRCTNLACMFECTAHAQNDIRKLSRLVELGRVADKICRIAHEGDKIIKDCESIGNVVFEQWCKSQPGGGDE